MQMTFSISIKYYHDGGKLGWGIIDVKDAEEKSDLYAAASLDAIHMVQQSA